MFFDEVVSVRVCQDDLKLIDKIVRKDKGEKYDNESHFIRCAVLKLIREERTRLRLR